MKNRICSIILCLLTVCLFACSCAKEEPPAWEAADAGSIDTSLYSPGTVCYSRLGYQAEILDAPGILLYESSGLRAPDGSIVGGLAFINKATGKSNLFCFDPLCHHNTENCLAATFFLMQDRVVYNAVANALYCIKPDLTTGGGGTSLYRVDMQASGATLVYEGDRNEISQICTSGKYVFWKHILTEERAELCRLNTENNQVDTYPAGGKSISSVRISGEYVYLSFTDEIEYYLTDPEFRETRKLEHFTVGTNWDYLNGLTVYHSVHEVGESYPDYVRVSYFCSSFVALDVLTGERRVILPEGDAYWVSGMSAGGDTIYYYAFSDIPHLYRMKTDGTGTKELIYTFDYAGMDLPKDYWQFNFCSVWEFSGTLYGKIEIRTGKKPYTLGEGGVGDSYFVIFEPTDTGYTLKRVTAGV